MCLQMPFWRKFSGVVILVAVGSNLEAAISEASRGKRLPVGMYGGCESEKLFSKRDGGVVNTFLDPFVWGIYRGPILALALFFIINMIQSQ